jgi:hypothetical protein
LKERSGRFFNQRNTSMRYDYRRFEYTKNKSLSFPPKNKTEAITYLLIIGFLSLYFINFKIFMWITVIGVLLFQVCLILLAFAGLIIFILIIFYSIYNSIKCQLAAIVLQNKGYHWVNRKKLSFLDWRQINFNSLYRLPRWEHLAATPYGREDPACLCAAVWQLESYRKKKRRKGAWIQKQIESTKQKYKNKMKGEKLTGLLSLRRSAGAIQTIAWGAQVRRTRKPQVQRSSRFL